jgi:hypothetical protein
VTLTVPSCNIPQGRLPFVAREQQGWLTIQIINASNRKDIFTYLDLLTVGGSFIDGVRRVRQAVH